MNIDLLAVPLPLPTTSQTSMRRRHHVDSWNPDRLAIGDFRRLATSLADGGPTPDVDALATTARVLVHDYATTRCAPCIRVRLRCLIAMHAMSIEQGWGLAADDRERIDSIVAYAKGSHRLVPDWIPVFGGLDDAILVDLAWSSLRFELDDFLDFRRLRRDEAALRGIPSHQVIFDRGQWLRARVAESSLLKHVRRCGLGSYEMSEAQPVFRVHG